MGLTVSTTVKSWIAANFPNTTDQNAVLGAAGISALFNSEVTAFAGAGGTITLAASGLTETSVSGLNITLLDFQLASHSGNNAQNLVDAMSYEFGHATIPGGIEEGAASPTQAGINGVNAEGVSILSQFIVDTQMNYLNILPNYSTSSRVEVSALQGQFAAAGVDVNGISFTSSGGVITGTSQFNSAFGIGPGTQSISNSAEWQSTSNFASGLLMPGAGNLTVSQFYQDNNVVVMSGDLLGNVNWAQVSQSDFSTTLGPGGVEMVALSNIPLNGQQGASGTMSVSGTFLVTSAGWSPTGVTTTVMNGSTLQYTQSLSGTSGTLTYTVSGSGDLIGASNSIINLAANGQAGVTGGGDKINLGANSGVTTTGIGVNTLSCSVGGEPIDTQIIIGAATSTCGTDGKLTTTGSNLTISANDAAGGTIVGPNNAVQQAPETTDTVSGASDTDTLGWGATANVSGTAVVNVTAPNATVNIGANSSATIDDLYTSIANAAQTALPDISINLAAGATVNANNIQVNVLDHGAAATVNGSGVLVDVSTNAGAQIGSILGEAIGGRNPFAARWRRERCWGPWVGWSRTTSAPTSGRR